jgi:hypothetical protein
MKLTASQVFAFALSLCAAVSSAAFAEGQIDPTREHAAAADEAVQFSDQSKALTGKERLGPKWSRTFPQSPLRIAAQAVQNPRHSMNAATAMAMANRARSAKVMGMAMLRFCKKSVSA